VDCDVSEVTSGTTETWEYADGTLARVSSDAILTRIDGRDPAECLPLYSAIDHGAGSFVRNADCWVADYDLTCISPSNDRYGPLMSGVAISSQCVLFAWHYHPEKGTKIRFVTADSETVERTIVDLRHID